MSMWRRELLSIPLAAAVRQETKQPLDDEVWGHFLAWLDSARPASDVLDLLARYASATQAGGVPESELHRRLTVVRRLLGQRNDAWPRMFDLIYASDSPRFRTKPTALLVSAVESRKPGRALDIAMGQGRNSVFLASRGWDAGGFDVSGNGLEAARKAAARLGVAVRAVQASHAEFPLGPEQWDLVVLTYAPVPFTGPEYARRLIASLRPQGAIVAESFAQPAQEARRTPVDIEPDALLKSYGALRLLHFEDVVAAPDWGTEPVRLIRFVAEKR